MDTCLPDWNTEFDVELPFSNQRKPLGADNGLVELLWQNGEVVLHTQNHKKPKHDPIITKSRQAYHRNEHSTFKTSSINPSNLIQDDETVSWIDCPIDDAFEKDFYTNFISEIPLDCSNKQPTDPVECQKFCNPSSSNNNNNNHIFPSSDLPPLPRFESFSSSHQQPNLKRYCPVGEIRECSALGSSHCGSNQVVNDMDMSSCGIGSRTLSSSGVDKNYGQEKVSPHSESTERETREQQITSSSGGSGSSSLWKTSNRSDETNRHKRKSREMEESECQSDATELESAAGNKSSQKSGSARRSRVAEVHNLSERRRRDRINEKMRALQELIPHSSKSDKASMLDEAIEYMKSLQLQLQLMWMGGGMAPMMVPGMQPYMARIGMGIGPPALAQFQNLMRLPRFPIVDQAVTMRPNPNPVAISQSPVLNPVNYQNQMKSPNFPEQFANYMGFHPMQSTSQPISMFNFGSQAPQKNQALGPPGNASGPLG